MIRADSPTMAAPPPTAGATPDEARRQQRERARDASEALARVNGALELQAAILALLLPGGSQRAARAWQIEAQAAPNAGALRDHVDQLPGAARLPWLEALASRMRQQSLDARQTMLEATRRVMGARGLVRPIDRLHWLALRQWLGEGSAASVRAAAQAELAQLPQAQVCAIATYSAFLSRMVPIDALHAAADHAEAAAGAAWYDTVMAAWQQHATIPPCQAPDTDGLVHALQELQTLAWMQRPMLVRGWVIAARRHSRHGRLGDAAADALRLSCTLLDAPPPPELAQHYGEFAQEARA